MDKPTQSRLDLLGYSWRGENRFILFVNVEPEEQNEVYEEMRIALANMQDVMTRRNEHPLLYAVDDLQTTGELVVLDRTQPLNQIHTTMPVKRLLFAGGNKIFYQTTFSATY